LHKVEHEAMHEENCRFFCVQITTRRKDRKGAVCLNHA